MASAGGHVSKGVGLYRPLAGQALEHGHVRDPAHVLGPAHLEGSRYRRREANGDARPGPEEVDHAVGGRVPRRSGDVEGPALAHRLSVVEDDGELAEAAEGLV